MEEHLRGLLGSFAAGADRPPGIKPFAAELVNSYAVSSAVKIFDVTCRQHKLAKWLRRDDWRTSVMPFAIWLALLTKSSSRATRFFPSISAIPSTLISRHRRT